MGEGLKNPERTEMIIGASHLLTFTPMAINNNKIILFYPVLNKMFIP